MCGNLVGQGLVPCRNGNPQGVALLRGRDKSWVVHVLWSAIPPIFGLSPEASPAAFGGICFCPSIWEGQQDNKDPVNHGNHVYYIQL